MSNPRATRPRLHHLAERIGATAALDGPAEALAGWVRGAVPRGPVKDALSGTALGHALHPLLTDLPIGTWTSAAILDVVGGRAARPASRRLIAAGLLAAVPAAATGFNDWADTTPADEGVRRVGAVHAVANVTALALHAASLAARRGERHGRGVALGMAGIGALAVGGHLGGHLSFAKGVGVDRTAFEAAPDEWTQVLGDAELAEGRLRGASANGQPIVLVRLRGRVHALVDHCVHRGGSLSEGELVGDCVECPLHGSRFRLEDGSVERGPAAYPQPVYDVRVEQGQIAVREA
jgi:nitrite reductase/ring-hydroxylating ferredoxin subunit/uncharacterized membrane protein